MRKILFVIIFSAVLFFSFLPFQNVSSQTENEPQNSSDEETAGLRSDLKTADVVAYVDIKELKFADRSDDKTDCENNTRGGYCSYLLTADVKEIFKGKTETKSLEFYVGTEATYPKKNLLGERIVFLVRSEGKPDKKQHLATIENSTRRIDSLETMRKIVNPQAAIDENNESEPYSFVSIKKEFEEADAVVYADAVSFAPDKDEDAGFEAFIIKAKIKEVFKGNLKSGKTIEYKTDFLYRPVRDSDLGEQVVFLERIESNERTVYKRINHTISDIQYNALEKLRKIASENSNKKK